jgi:hypothetical protein
MTPPDKAPRPRGCFPDKDLPHTQHLVTLHLLEAKKEHVGTILEDTEETSSETLTQARKQHTSK